MTIGIMRFVRSLVVVTAIAPLTITLGLAQFPEDALRFATTGLGIGARAIGMGGAFTGVASDYSAIFWNPAGLAQLEHNEFSFGLSHLTNKDKGTFLGSSQSFSNNSTNLNALGLAFPVPVRRGSLVFAFGYSRQSNFTTGVSLSRITSNGIAQDFAPDGGVPGRDGNGDLAYNLAYELYLADTLNGRWDSPIKSQLAQSEKTLEGGGINNYSVGAGVDLARNLSAGVSLQYHSGTYTLDRNYVERDNLNIYSSPNPTNPRNFDNLMIDDFVESELTGFSAKAGILFRQPDRFRFGLTVTTPIVYRVKERFGTTYTNTPDHGTVVTIGENDIQTGEYDVATPWVLGAGASVIIRDLVLSGDVEYTDWSQLEFRNANADLLAKNRKFKDLFRATLNLRGGLEYDIRDIGVRVRGGFIYNTSPYQGDPSSFDQKYATGGLGFQLSESTMLDLTFARGWWRTFRNDYRGLANIDENVTTNNFGLTFSYRF